MGRKSISHLRKPEILKSTYKIIQEEGLEGASITKIARQMGVNSGIIINYYKNKETLILALVEFMLEKAMDSYHTFIKESNIPPEKYLGVMVDYFFDPDLKPLRSNVFWACFALSFRSRKTKIEIRKMYRFFIDQLILFLNDAHAGQEIEVEDTQLLANILITAIDGVGYLKLIQGNTPEVRQTHTFYKEMIKDLLKSKDRQNKDRQDRGLISLSNLDSDKNRSEIKAAPLFQKDSGSLEPEVIIDLGLHLPPTKKEIVEKLGTLISSPESANPATCQSMAGPRWVECLGMSFEKLFQKTQGLSKKAAEKVCIDFAEQLTMTPASFINRLEPAGIEWGMIFSSDNSRTAAMIKKFPTRLKGLALVDPHESDASVKTEEAVKKFGFSAIHISPLYWHLPAGDPKFYPIYSKANELNIPVFIHSAMNYDTRLPMDIGRPAYIDPVAMSFPDLKIVACCGGWPWVNEMVGVARRHKNIYIDTSFHRPRDIATPGSGWEMLLQFGNTLLQDQIIFGSGAGDVGLPLPSIIQEAKKLPFKEKVKQKWLYDNAHQLFESNIKK